MLPSNGSQCLFLYIYVGEKKRSTLPLWTLRGRAAWTRPAFWGDTSQGGSRSASTVLPQKPAGFAFSGPHAWWFARALGFHGTSLCSEPLTFNKMAPIQKWSVIWLIFFPSYSVVRVGNEGPWRTKNSLSGICHLLPVVRQVCLLLLQVEQTLHFTVETGIFGDGNVSGCSSGVHFSVWGAGGAGITAVDGLFFCMPACEEMQNHTQCGHILVLFHKHSRRVRETSIHGDSNSPSFLGLFSFYVINFYYYPSTNQARNCRLNSRRWHYCSSHWSRKAQVNREISAFWEAVAAGQTGGGNKRARRRRSYCRGRWRWEADWDLLFEQRHNKITSLPPSTRPEPPLVPVGGRMCRFRLQEKRRGQRKNLGAPQGGFQILVRVVLHRHQRGSAAGPEMPAQVANSRSGRGWRPCAAAISVFPLIPFLSEARWHSIPPLLLQCQPFSSFQKREMGGGGRTERITAVWINAVFHTQPDRNEEICAQFAITPCLQPRGNSGNGNLLMCVFLPLSHSESERVKERGPREERQTDCPASPVCFWAGSYATGLGVSGSGGMGRRGQFSSEGGREGGRKGESKGRIEGSLSTNWRRGTC